jgi:hypothetical protein
MHTNRLAAPHRAADSRLSRSLEPTLLLAAQEFATTSVIVDHDLKVIGSNPAPATIPDENPSNFNESLGFCFGRRRFKSLFARFRFGVTACAGHAVSNFELRV